MANYILRKVDDDLWTRFRDRVQANGQTLRWVLLALIAYYIDHGMPTKKR